MKISNRQRSRHSSTGAAAWGACAVAMLVLPLVVLSGCGEMPEFFAQKPTELESRNTLRELMSIQENPNTAVQKPEIYAHPPEIVEGVVAGEAEVKLYYFCKYHSAADILGMINSQFLAALNDHAGKPLPRAPYTISQNPSTHQLIITTATREAAEQVLEFLQLVDVPPVQIKIDCMISEVYADHTMDWETRTMIENLFGQEITLDGYLPGAALRDVAREGFGVEAEFRGQQDEPGHRFSAMVDMLVSRGYLKILMNPQVEVVNGEKAVIKMEEQVPLDLVSSINPATGVIRFNRDYASIVDSLQITPHVFADGSIGLETVIVTGAKSTPEGVSQTPVVTRREIKVDENRIRSGETLVIGGLRKTEQRSVVRGVPLLKDIPIIGVLFSSKDFEERGKEIIFMLTPSISTGGVPNRLIVDELRRKHTPIAEPTILDNLTDPFSHGAYTDVVEEEATHAEVMRMRAEMERTAAERKAQALEQRLLQATEQVEQQQTRAAEAQQAATDAAAEVQASEQKAAAAEAERKKAVEEAAAKAAAAKEAAAEAEKKKQEALQQKAAAEKAIQEAQAEIDAWMKKAGKTPPKAETPPAQPPQGEAPKKE